MPARHVPIRRKLMAMILATSGVVLLLTCSAFIGYELFTYRRNSVQQLATLGEIIAAESTGAMAFDNQRDATEILAALKADRQVVAAALYDRQGKLFSRYPADAPDARFPPRPAADGHIFAGGYLISTTPVIQLRGSERFGTLMLSSDLEPVYARLRLYGIISGIVIIACSLVAFLLSRTLQQQISRPIQALAETARAVSDRRDYTVRAHKQGEDELGILTDAFNHMLARIQEQNEELERRVRERTAELESANDELEAFCSSAAHDLRTPLRAITGLTDLLLDERRSSLAPDAKRYVSLIRSGSDQASDLINDLLSFSRLGRQELARRAVPTEALCRQAWDTLQSEARHRRIEFRIDPLPAVHADPSLLRVVFVNLLSNALKYSRPRELATIHVGTAGEEAGAPILFVRDNGVGFDLRNAEKLFGVFQRLHHSHEFEGTGVGLATVRRIVERHGGRIWADAQPDAGATFYFTLPRA